MARRWLTESLARKAGFGRSIILQLFCGPMVDVEYPNHLIFGPHRPHRSLPLFSEKGNFIYSPLLFSIAPKLIKIFNLL